MPRSFRINATPREIRTGIVHIALLVITLAVAWEHDGSPPLRAFWAIVAYFVEIAVYGVAEVILQARYG
ncbi:MAG TPA: hypothetical protein VFC46_14345, partial [Humisphaera sp.]|nr:hypothetical protein [Humisphaera sp.]